MWNIPDVSATSLDDLPDPETTPYGVCFYVLDASDDISVLAYDVIAPAGLGCGRDPFRGATAIELRTIEVALGRILRRRDDVEQAARLVHAREFCDVGIEARDQRRLAAFARDAIDVLPPVPFAQPQKRAAVVDPRDLVHDFDPGRRAVAEDAAHFAGPRVSHEQVVLVL